MVLYRQLALRSLVDHETLSNVSLTEVLSKGISSRYRELIEIDAVKIGDMAKKDAAIRRLDAEVKQLMRRSKLVKIKIYNLNGLTIYPTDSSQINQVKSNNAGFLSARAGKSVSTITFRHQFDTFEGMLSNVDVVSSFIPIRSDPTGKPEAVFEVYSDVTDLIHQMQRLLWQTVVMVLGIVVIFYTLFIIYSRRVERIGAARLEEASRSEAQLRYHARHDALTGLINRHEFERRAKRMISTSQEGTGEHALCFIDLDQFKLVNDTYGHTAGDELLRQLGSVLQDTVRQRDTLARLGGDEFVVLMEHCTLYQAQWVVTALLKVIQEFQFSWEGQSIIIGASIGLVSITETTANLTELMKEADAACYRAKDLGRNRIHVHYSEDIELTQRRSEMQWVTRIKQALEENRYTLYTQPIVPLGQSTDKNYEILLRMVSESGDIIAPDEFLPTAERYDLMDKLDGWTIENTFRLLASHPAFVEQLHFISINLSGQSLTKGEFLNSIVALIREFKIDASKICFEITETAAISNLSAAITFISSLKELGCRFALDDFGSGFSSYGYLKSLPVDYLKIDGMFVKDIVDGPIDRAMVNSINDIGHVMGMKTIAEYVENNEIESILRDISVDYAQGYYTGTPQPFDQILVQQNEDRNVA